MTNAVHQDYSRIARNSMFSIVRFLVLLPLPLVVLPFMLSRLGDERFGIWALVALFTSYTQLADFGMGLALTKYVAEYQARRDWSRTNTAINTVFFFYLAVALIIAGAVFAARHSLATFVPDVTPAMVEEISVIIGITAITFAVNLTFGAFSSVLQGLQRMDVTNLVSFGAGVALYAGIVIVLALGFGLTGLLVLSLAIALATSTVNLVMVRRLVPHFRLRLAAFDRHYLRTILSYSLNIQGGTLADLLFDPATKLTLTRFLGVATVAQYEVGQRVTVQLRNLFSVALLPVFPGVSYMDAGEGRERVYAVHQRSTRYVFLFGLPAYVFLIVTAPWLLTAWLGPGYEPAAFVLRLMTAGWFISLLAAPPYFILQALGYARLCMIAHVTQGVANVALALLLVGRLGFEGVTLAACCALVIGAAIVIGAFAATLDVSLARFLASIPWRAACLTAALAAVLALSLPRLGQVGLPGMAGIAALYFGVYGLLVLAMGSLSASDWQLVQSMLPLRWQRLAQPLSGARAKHG